MFKSVNRDAIIVTPHKKFRDWASFVIPKPPNINYFPDPYTDRWTSIYLIPDAMKDEEVNEYVKANFQEIFEGELSLWCSEEERWPQQRTWELFCEWFDVRHQRAIKDTVNKAIREHY